MKAVILFLFTISISCKSQDMTSEFSRSLNNPTSFQLVDGVIIDDLGNNIFIISPEGSNQAIITKTGKVAWEGAKELKPLSVANNILQCIKIDNRVSRKIQMRQYDVRDGYKEIDNYSIDMSSEFKDVDLENTAGRFNTLAQTEDGQTVLFWSYQQFPRKGRIDDEQEDQQHHFSGAYEINNANKVTRKLESSEISKLRNKFSLMVPQSNRIEKVEEPQYLSKNAKHILVSEKLKDPKDERDQNSYSWTLYQLESKEKVGTITAPKSYSPFFIKDNIIIYIDGPGIDNSTGKNITIPYQLVAKELGSGSLLWKKSIKNMNLLGPTPS